MMASMMTEMEEMQQWWCVDQQNLATTVCETYGKSKLTGDEVKEAMKPDWKELDAMHTVRQDSKSACYYELV